MLPRIFWIVVFPTVLMFSSMYGIFALPDVADTTIPEGEVAIKRGEYLVSAGGCISCHEDIETGQLSGGMALESDFGVFYVPNITPHESTGIGSWSGEDFLLAMKHGRSPDRSFYFPAFPYRSYAGLTDTDVLDIAAYLRSLTPIESIVPEHEIPAWLFRWMMAGWNIVADLQPSPSEIPAEPQLQRGAYLARSLGHCGECHTPRNVIGIPDVSREFAGAELSDAHVEAIDSTALTNWTEEDFAFLLFLGMKPDGEYVGGEMEAVIEHNTSKLTEEDRLALAAFFKHDPS
ncbi:MAG: cytochrome c [Pseudomonadota bacterium]